MDPYLPNDGTMAFHQLTALDFDPGNVYREASAVFGGNRGIFLHLVAPVLVPEFQYYSRTWGSGSPPPWSFEEQPETLPLLDALDLDFAVVTKTNSYTPTPDTVESTQLLWRIGWVPLAKGGNWNFLHLRYQMQEWLWSPPDPYPSEPSDEGTLQDFWWNDDIPEGFEIEDRLTWPGTPWSSSLPTVTDPVEPEDGTYSNINIGWHKLRILWPTLNGLEAIYGYSPPIPPAESPKFSIIEGLIPGVRGPDADYLHPKFGDLHVGLPP